MQRRLGKSSRILPLTAATAALLVWLNQRDVYSDAFQQQQQPSSSALRPTRSSSLLFSGSTTSKKALCAQRREEITRLKAVSNDFSMEQSRNTRTGTTPADEIFQKYNQIPEPAVKHAVIPSINKEDGERSGILVIGDVHGCYDELLLLYEKAMAENHGRPFHYVIAVGDLCNKGPKSAAVIRHVRLTDRWLSVRGNHENGVLHAVLGDPRQQKKEKYNWIDQLSDDDVMWLAQLPYTIRIPGAVLNENVDTIIVHAGLVPGLELEKQSFQTMVNLRELEEEASDSDRSMGERTDQTARYAWASLWKGPEKVIFGHDAKRGLQEYERVTGLDTGAVYGKQLTGIILPKRNLVQVDSLATHCPIDSD